MIAHSPLGAFRPSRSCILRRGIATTLRAVPIVVLLLALTIAGPGAAREVPVGTGAALIAAIGDARPGDEIVLADGDYWLSGSHGVDCRTPGTADLPIVVRAAEPLAARIHSTAIEAFVVSAPHWAFKGLDIEGVCADDSTCEHAFHVVGRATGFQMTGNRILNFNAHLKVNADLNRETPDGGLVEGNLVSASHPRDTTNPVSFLNIDHASGWTIRDNAIVDFHKAQGDRTSFGGYAKGGARSTVFERNLVLCSSRDTEGGTRIGLSFGGDGMDPKLCVPAWNASVPCDPESTDGTMRNNVIANCSGAGISLNRADRTAVLYNTVIATAGIDFRFPSSTGEAHGNALTSKIRGRSGGSFGGSDNFEDVPVTRFRSLFRDPLHGDFRISGDPGWLVGKGDPGSAVIDDYCGRARGDGPLDWGALQISLGDCAPTGGAPSRALPPP
jgi:hypothetical protein